MRIRQAELLEKAKQGPVVLIERGSKPAGVLVSPEQWDALNKRIKQLELLAEARRAIAEMEQDPAKRIAHAELRRQLTEKVAAP
jgi:prevent-host-death family protein